MAKGQKAKLQASENTGFAMTHHGKHAHAPGKHHFIHDEQHKLHHRKSNAAKVH